MPIFSKRSVNIDYIDEGHGESVVLIHSSVSANRQWRALSKSLKDRYRALAINLFGYGDTTPWPGDSPQTLHAHADLVLGLCEELEGPVHLVGHSLGGSVALQAAMNLGQRLGSLILLEPNTFYLLKQFDRTQALLELRVLHDYVKHFGSLGDWETVAQRFADYWLGDGSWNEMPGKRRVAFAESMPPNFHELDAVMGEQTTIDDCKALTSRTLLVSDKVTQLPIHEIVKIFEQSCTHWSFHFIPEGGHMAPLTRPDLINAVVREFLDAGFRTESDRIQ